MNALYAVKILKTLNHLYYASMNYGWRVGWKEINKFVQNTNFLQKVWLLALMMNTQ